MNPDKPIKITRDHGFLAMPNWVHDRIRTNQIAQATYLELVRYADKDRDCWPSRATLAKGQGLSVASIKRGLKALKDSGAVIVTEAGKTLGESNHYHLPWVPVGGSVEIPLPVGGGSPESRVPGEPGVGPRGTPNNNHLTITNPSFAFGPLTMLLKSLLLGKRSDAKITDAQLVRWTEEEDRLIRIDKRNPEEAEKVLRWAHEVSDFWPGNIRSIPKFREKYETLREQMERDAKRKMTPGEKTMQNAQRWIHGS